MTSPLFAYLHLPWMLLGLVVLVVPPLIHLLNRRRYEVVDWGAMQFLRFSERTRRRLVVEEWLLLLVRMGLLAVLVFALAGPFFDWTLPATSATRPPCDVVLVLDGSGSMATADTPTGPAPIEVARRWARALVDDLGTGSTVAVLVAREQIQPLVGGLSLDRGRVRAALDTRIEPSGRCDWPLALRRATEILDTGQNPQRQIVFLSDVTQQGWADRETLLRWELLARETPSTETIRPRLWLVNCAPDRPARLPNYALTNLQANRPVVSVDREVRFRGEITLNHVAEYHPPQRLRLLINGKHVRDLPPPGGSLLSSKPSEPTHVSGRSVFPFTFTHRFGQPGTQLVSVVLEVDPPTEQQPPGYTPRDCVPGDNRRDLALEVVPALSVLLVRGESVGPTSDFLRDALAPARDPHPAVLLQQLEARDLTPARLSGPARPLVLVLYDVPRLEPAALEAVAAFLTSGGSVLVVLGEQVDRDWYNQFAYHGGDGWLPARLERMQGDERQLARAARLDPASLTHPILELFAKQTAGSLAEARFPRWWQLQFGRTAAGVGLLRGADGQGPLFVERAYRTGGVLVSAVPFDPSWGSNLIDLPAFVPLVHEAVYYLAGTRSADYNLPPGRPLQVSVSETARLEDFRLRPPHQSARPLGKGPDHFRARLIPQPGSQLLLCEEVGNAGVYELQTPDRVVYFVVQPDPRESDLTPCTEADRQQLSDLLGLNWASEPGELLEAPQQTTQRQELWFVLLLGLIGLLCVEVALTRRMVRNRM